MRLRDNDDHEFQEFIQSISVTAVELEAIIQMPELPIREVKRIVAQGERTVARTSHVSFAHASPRSRRAILNRALAGAK